MTFTKLAWFLPMIACTAACSYARVGSGEVAVVRTPDGVSKQVYKAGDWSIGINDHVQIYNARAQERAEQLAVLASNGLRIVLDASIRYHIIAEEAVELDQSLGVHYYDTLLGPTLRSQARRVVGRFQPEEIYSTQRDAIERQIREGIEAAVKGHHIVLEAVLIRNVELPATIQAAINNKLEAEQHALKMKFIIDQARADEEKKLMEVKAEAEQERIRAEALATTQRIGAQAEAEAIKTKALATAEAKRIDGVATSEFQKSVSQHLSELLLRWKQIEATRALATSENSKLIFMGASGSGAAPILDLRSVPLASTR